MTGKETDDRQTAESPADLRLPGQSRLADSVRATLVLAGFLGLTLPCMPVQWLLLRIAPGSARTFPYWYHRRVCRLLGIRLHIEGAVSAGQPVLLVSNHVSWLDIPVLSAVAPLSFVAKSEVSRWPFVSALAKLQRTVFVDRGKRSDVARVTSEMTDRLETGDTLVLFAEGTSTDGNRVLPFKTALLAPAFSGGGRAAGDDQGSSGSTANAAVVQTLSLTYTHIHGVPIGRAERSVIGWYGDMDMAGHAWSVLKAGPIDVRISIGDPVALESFQGRKDLAGFTEGRVREGVIAALRGRKQDSQP